ncbi:hypothetical protein BRC81_17385 [Halobacteriales archaeon QS_1_68_20]|nr:MAG: hypothetical protein BRC81_17385 [Halobacteriales archaeon QS_1_68_20]
METRTALRIGAGVIGAALLFLVVKIVVGWLFRLAMLFGVALLVVGLAYAAYRIWIAPDGREDAPEAGRDASAEPVIGDDLDGGSGVGSSDVEATLSDEEFERELEELGEDS